MLYLANWRSVLEPVRQHLRSWC